VNDSARARLAPGGMPARFGVRVHASLAEAWLVEELARATEANGLDSFWIVDHPCPVGGYLKFLEAQQVDAVLACAWAARATRAITVGTAALVAGLRPVPVVVNELRTLQELAAGRLRAGIAAGWNREEFDVVGVPFSERGRRCDAVLEALREGSPPVPVLVAGGRVPASHGQLGRDEWPGPWLRRARLADGWLVRPQATPELLAEGLAKLGPGRRRGEAGFAVVHVNYAALDPDPAVRRAQACAVLGPAHAGRHGSDYWLGELAETKAQIRAMLDAGATEVVAHLVRRDPSEVERWAQVAEEVRGS
jgi:alkanesulfonate monooxygenase SsuD/methylene tetrahydromethanopterin reductase-like flavin-dependent oxidoreductase (luciferase family)